MLEATFKRLRQLRERTIRASVAESVSDPPGDEKAVRSDAETHDFLRELHEELRAGDEAHQSLLVEVEQLRAEHRDRAQQITETVTERDALAHELSVSRRAQAASEEARVRLAAELASETARRANLDACVASLNSDRNQLARERGRLANDLEAQVTRRKELETRVASAVAERDEFLKEHDRLAVDLENEASRLKELDAHLAGLAKERGELAKQNEILVAERDSETALRRNLEERVIALTAERNVLTKERGRLAADLETEAARRKDLDARNAATAAERGELAKERNRLLVELEDQAPRRTELEARIHSLLTEQVTLRADQGRLEDDVARLLMEGERLRDDLKRATAEGAELRQRCTALAAERSTMEAHGNREAAARGSAERDAAALARRLEAQAGELRTLEASHAALVLLRSQDVETRADLELALEQSGADLARHRVDLDRARFALRQTEAEAADLRQRAAGLSARVEQLTEERMRWAEECLGEEVHRRDKQIEALERTSAAPPRERDTASGAPSPSASASPAGEVLPPTAVTLQRMARPVTAPSPGPGVAPAQAQGEAGGLGQALHQLEDTAAKQDARMLMLTLSLEALRAEKAEADEERQRLQQHLTDLDGEGAHSPRGTGGMRWGRVAAGGASLALVAAAFFGIRHLTGSPRSDKVLAPGGASAAGTRTPSVPRRPPPRPTLDRALAAATPYGQAGQAASRPSPTVPARAVLTAATPPLTARTSPDRATPRTVTEASAAESTGENALDALLSDAVAAESEARDDGALLQAAARYQEVLRVEPQSEEARTRLTAIEDGFSDRGDTALGQGDYGRAVQSFAAAIEIDPKRAEHAFNRGRATFGAATDGSRDLTFDQALADFDRAIALDSRRAEYFFGRSLCRLNAAIAGHPVGDLEKAIIDLDQAIALDPNQAMYHFARANARYQGMLSGSVKGDTKAVVADINRAIALEPDNAEYLFRRGQVLHETYHVESSIDALASAVRDYTRAIEIDADNASYYVWRARAWGEQGDKPREEADLARARALGYGG